MKLFDRGVLRLAAPVFAGHLLSFLFGAADTVFISMLDRESTANISGVGLTMPLNLLALAVGTGLMSGTASLVGRALGAKDRKKVAAAGRAALYLGTISALILGLLFILGADALIGLLSGAEVGAETRAAAGSYLLYVTPGFAILALELALLGLLMGEGKTVAYGSAMALGTVANLVLDPLFIFVLGWGIRGAAAATTLATAIGCASIVLTLAKEADRFGLAPRSFLGGTGQGGSPISAAKEILRVGLPQALSLLVVSLSFMVLNRVLGGFGETRLTAWIVVGRIEECVLMIGYAVGGACMFMASTSWGAGNRQELENSIDRCLSTAAAACVLVLLPYVALAPLVFRAFSGNADVVAACAKQVRFVSWSTPGVVLSLVAASGLQGMGKAAHSLAIIIVRLGLFLLLPVFFLSATDLLTIPSFFAIFAASSVGGGFISILSLKRQARTLSGKTVAALLSL